MEHRRLADAMGQCRRRGDLRQRAACRPVDVAAPRKSSGLAATLPAAGQERLERLRGFGASFGRTLTCACSRVVLGDGKPAVLIAAAEPVGPQLPLGERSVACSPIAKNRSQVSPPTANSFMPTPRRRRVCAERPCCRRSASRHSPQPCSKPAVRAVRRTSATRLSRSKPRVSAKMLPACCCSQYRSRLSETPVGESARQEMAAIRHDRTARDAVRRGGCDRGAGHACRGRCAGGGAGFRFERDS